MITLFSYRNRDEITDDVLAEAKLFVLAGCQEKFSAAEVRIHFTLISNRFFEMYSSMFSLRKLWVVVNWSKRVDFQFEVVKKHVDSGGGLLVMLGEGGETKYETNINFLLEEFGIMINSGEWTCHY